MRWLAVFLLLLTQAIVVTLASDEQQHVKSDDALVSALRVRLEEKGSQELLAQALEKKSNSNDCKSNGASCSSDSDCCNYCQLHTCTSGSYGG